MLPKDEGPWKVELETEDLDSQVSLTILPLLVLACSWEWSPVVVWDDCVPLDLGCLTMACVLKVDTLGCALDASLFFLKYLVKE